MMSKNGKDTQIWSELYSKKAKRTTKKQNYFASCVSPQHSLVLELFVASGQNCEIIKKNNPKANFVGIDYDFDLCRIAKHNGAISVNADCRALPFKAGKFDLIYSNSFHHVSKNVKETIDECMRLLKTGGLLVGVEPYGMIASLFAGIIYYLPDIIISMLPKKIETYVKAIKFECHHEGVIHWFYCYDIIKDLKNYNLISNRKDILRLYYCIQKNK
jgi:SAM-dependent methyltransferase